MNDPHISTPPFSHGRTTSASTLTVIEFHWPGHTPAAGGCRSGNDSKDTGTFFGEPPRPAPLPIHGGGAVSGAGAAGAAGAAPPRPPAPPPRAGAGARRVNAVAFGRGSRVFSLPC